MVSNGCPTRSFVRPETVPPTKPFMEAPVSEGEVKGLEGEELEEDEERGRVGCASGVEGFGGGSSVVCVSEGIVDAQVQVKGKWRNRRCVPPQFGVKDEVYILNTLLLNDVRSDIEGWC